MISINIARKAFGAQELLRDVKLAIGEAESVAIVGASGVGKSTLLRIAVGLDAQFDGSAHCHGRIGMVFQEPNLLNWRTVQNNLSVFHPSASAMEINDALLNVGLDEHAKRFPKQLSLGQQRRLSLARAFLGQPEILIMDEPFTSLDPDIKEEMFALTEMLMARSKPAMMLVTHDMDEATRLAQRTLRLEGRPACLREVD